MEDLRNLVFIIKWSLLSCLLYTSIVDTDIQTFDIEASNLRKQRDEALKAIDSKLHSLNVEKTVLEQEREELQKVIEDYKTQLEDKTRNKAISALKGKRTRLVNIDGSQSCGCRA